jgi:hypothetical protein
LKDGEVVTMEVDLRHIRDVWVAFLSMLTGCGPNVIGAPPRLPAIMRYIWGIARQSANGFSASLL